MGGHNAGDEASAIAISSLTNQFLKVSSDVDYSEFLRKTLKDVNMKIYEKSIIHTEKMGMGTTIVATIIEPNSGIVVTASVGDSRAYYISGSQIIQITEDDSVVQELIKKGEITADDAKKSPLKNIITNSLGISRDFKIEITKFILKKNHQLLLCSDGLTDRMSDNEIFEELSYGNHIRTEVENCINTSLEYGGLDNVTVIIADHRGKDV